MSNQVTFPVPSYTLQRIINGTITRQIDRHPFNGRFSKTTCESRQQKS